MLLPGRLRLTTLGDVLGAVYREGATGSLELTEMHGASMGRVHRVHVACGLVIHVDADVATARLGEILRRQRLIDDDVLRRLGDVIAWSPGRRAGELLVDMRAVTPADVGKGLRLQRRERLERLFLLDDARIAFRVARGVGQDVATALGPNEFLYGRARSRDVKRDGTTASDGHRRRDPVRSRALSTLGLAETAGPTDVQRAFRELASKMHPDRFPTAGAADRADLMRRFAQITAAYHALVA